MCYIDVAFDFEHIA